MFDALTSRMSRTLAGLRSRGRINPVDLESTLGEIRTALLEADVALIVVDQLISEVRRRGLEALSLKQSGINPAQQVITIIHEEILKVLGTNARSLATASRSHCDKPSSRGMSSVKNRERAAPRGTSIRRSSVSK